MQRTFRLFISSPFKDFTKEREVLHTKVFPRINQYCIEQGFSFQPIDLRWGVNNEAQLDQKTLEVCLEEVKACKHFPHPNFLIMAGDRYGYIPLPYMIEKKEFENIKTWSTNNNKPIELLDYWYKEDKNQIPSEDENSTAYILQRREEKYTIYKNWEAEESALRAILQEAVEATIKDKNSQAYQKYFLSATEQEAIEGISDYGYKTSAQITRDNAMDKAYVFGYLRTIPNASGDYIDEKSSLKSKAKDFKETLKNTLLKENIHLASYTSESSNFDDFENYFYEHLEQAISGQITQAISLTPLEKEILEQLKFKREKLKGFLGREKTLSSISNYLGEDATKQPFVIYGPSGMGKSSLMAKAIEETEERLNNTHLLYRFVGATQGSSSLRVLLISLMDELHDKGIINWQNQYESDDNKFYIQIKEILLSIKHPTTIFIDALDQLQDKSYLQWLPESLPEHLKLVISVLKDEKYDEDSHFFRICAERVDKTHLLDITLDSLESEKENLLKALLAANNRRLQKNQILYVITQWEKAHYSPLYLKIALEEIKNWPSYQDKSERKLSQSVEGVIEEFISNLSLLYHHEPIFVDKVFGYIHASKDGLSEKELLEILSEDLEDEKTFENAIINEYHTPIRVKNPRRKDKEEEELILPFSLWSRIHTQIKPFIVERAIDNLPLMKFFHRQFTTVVEKYIGQNKKALHVKLSEYYRSISFDLMVKQDEIKMKLKNFMYHLFCLSEFEKLEILMIMFNDQIVEHLYKDDLIGLISIYNFDSNVLEVKKIQGLKFILDTCFTEKNKKYLKKSYETIDVTPDTLQEYGIENFKKFDAVFKKMINTVGMNKFILEEPQEDDVDDLAWMNHYSLKHNHYVKLYMALIGKDYFNFDLEAVIEDHTCDTCNCVRAKNQFRGATCKKCDIEMLIENCEFDQLKEYYLDDIKAYIDDEDYFELFEDSYEEWKNNNQNDAENEFAYLNEEFDEYDQPRMEWDMYLESNTSDDNFKNAYNYDIADYVREVLEYEEFTDVKSNYLNEQGFSNE